jgi:mevalonate kinase
MRSEQAIPTTLTQKDDKKIIIQNDTQIEQVIPTTLTQENDKKTIRSNDNNHENNSIDEENQEEEYILKLVRKLKKFLNRKYFDKENKYIGRM